MNLEEEHLEEGAVLIKIASTTVITYIDDIKSTMEKILCR